VAWPSDEGNSSMAATTGATAESRRCRCRALKRADPRLGCFRVTRLACF